MRVERARPGDEAAVRTLLEDAASWLTARGIRQWLPGALPEAVITSGIARGSLFVVRDGGALAASLDLSEEDPPVWGPSDGTALYLHRLVVARSHARRGLGAKLLDWARNQVRRRGHTRLCLDCVASNAFLRRYYADAGFAERGLVDLGQVQLARFEQSVLDYNPPP